MRKVGALTFMVNTFFPSLGPLLVGRNGGKTFRLLHYSLNKSYHMFLYVEWFNYKKNMRIMGKVINPDFNSSTYFNWTLAPRTTDYLARDFFFGVWMTDEKFNKRIIVEISSSDESKSLPSESDLPAAEVISSFTCWCFRNSLIFL